MAAAVAPQLTEFASDVATGLTDTGQKRLAPKYFYDDLGSALFEAITLLPEYGLTRADERLLRLHANDIVREIGRLRIVAELGSGSGKKTLPILNSVLPKSPRLTYRPIDISTAALAACEREIGSLCEVAPVCNDWLQGLAE